MTDKITVKCIGICLGILFGLFHQTVGADARIGYSIAVSHVSIRDDLLVPLRFGGPGGSIGAFVGLKLENWDFDASVTGGMNYVANRYGHGGGVWPMSIGFDAGRKMLKLPHGGTFHLNVPVHIGFHDYYLFSWDDAHLYWLTAYWAGIGMRYEQKLNDRWVLAARFDTPLLSLVDRPVDYRHKKQDPLKQIKFYFAGTNDNLQAGTVDQYRGLRCSIKLSKRMKKTDISIGANYSYFVCYRADNAYNSALGLEFAQTWRMMK